MAKVSFNSIPERDPNSGNGAGNAQVRFFNLKSGESAIVRIMVDTVDDLDIRTVHNVEMPGYQYGRRMNCLRSPQEPIELCPLCRANKKLEQKLYLKMIQYTVDPVNGVVNKEAKVWERSVWDKYFGAQVIKANLEAYGPLSEMICKIERRGERLNTEYQLMPNLNPAVYRPDIYVKDTSMFDGWDPLGIAILDKTAAEYDVFLTTGQFPQTAQTPNNIPASPAQAAPQQFNAASATPRTPYDSGLTTADGYAHSTYTAPQTTPAYISPEQPAAPSFVPGVTPNPAVEIPSTPNFTQPQFVPPATPQTPAATPATTFTPPANAPRMPWEAQPLPNEGDAPVMARPQRHY